MATAAQQLSSIISASNDPIQSTPPQPPTHVIPMAMGVNQMGPLRLPATAAIPVAPTVSIAPSLDNETVPMQAQPPPDPLLADIDSFLSSILPEHHLPVNREDFVKLEELPQDAVKSDLSEDVKKLVLTSYKGYKDLL